MKIILTYIQNLQSDELKLATSILRQKKFSQDNLLLGEEKLKIYQLEEDFCYWVLELVFSEEIKAQFIDSSTQDIILEEFRVVIQDIFNIVVKLILPHFRANNNFENSNNPVLIIWDSFLHTFQKQ